MPASSFGNKKRSRALVVERFDVGLPHRFRTTSVRPSAESTHSSSLPDRSRLIGLARKRVGLSIPSGLTSEPIQSRCGDSLESNGSTLKSATDNLALPLTD